MKTKKQRVKAIIFDCDGTLIDTEQAHFLSWQMALQKHGAPFTRQDYYAYSGHSGILISKELHDRLKIASPEILRNDKLEAYNELRKKATPPIHHVVNWVHELAAQKDEIQIKLGVASAACKEEILMNLHELGITGHFDVVVSGVDDLSHYNDPEGVNKPKPYIYLHSAKLLGLDPAECVAVEDSRPGVLAASRAGFITVAVPNDFTRTHDFSAAHLIIKSDEGIDSSQFLKLVSGQLDR